MYLFARKLLIRLILNLSEMWPYFNLFFCLPNTYPTYCLICCSAFPTGSLPMDIVWVHNEDELNPEDPDYIQVSEGNTHRLLITAAFPEDSGTYICEAYNDAGEADTACELTVVG